MANAEIVKVISQDVFMERADAKLNPEHFPGQSLDDIGAHAAQMILDIEHIEKGELVVKPPLDPQLMSALGERALANLELVKKSASALNLTKRGQRRLARQIGSAIEESRSQPTFRGEGTASKV